MPMVLRWCALGLLLWQVSAQKSVAVIGGGIAGASAAKFLREELGSEGEIVVFEKEESVGGRMALELLKHDNQPGYQNLEMGATLLYTGNYYARGMAQEVGLTERIVPGEWFAFWDGVSLTWESLPSKLLTSVSLFMRYNFSLVKLMRLVNRIIQAFLRIYDMQANGQAFEDPKELLEAVNLFDLTQQNITAFLGKHGVRGKIVQEVVSGVNANNYNQDNSMNALAGCVSLCPMVSGSIFFLKEGNFHLPKRILAAYANRTELKTAVTRVSIMDGHRYRLWALERDLGEFDAVVVAAPVEVGGIQFEGAASGSIVGVKAPRRKFQEVETSWVKGEVRPAYFRGSEGWWGRLRNGVIRRLQGRQELPVPSNIYLTADGAVSPRAPHLCARPRQVTRGAGQRAEEFSSLARCGPGVYKLFSRSRLGEGALGALFEPSWRVVARKRWTAAYPKFSPPETFASFRLVRGERIYYPNAIENAASCLEMEAVAAKNVALLAARDLGLRPHPSAPSRASSRPPRQPPAEL